MSRIFSLTQQQRTNLNRRMKLGFCLVKLQDYQKMPINDVQINFTPELVPRQSSSVMFPFPEPSGLVSIASNISDASVFSTSSANVAALAESLSKLKPPPVQLTESAKIRNTERLKAIVQKFKKHKKFTILTSSISKAGRPEILYYLGRIQEEIKKHMHTLDSFKTNVIQLLDLVKDVPTLSDLVYEIKLFFENLIVEEKQMEFDSSLQDLQKNVDKITRELGETKEFGQWFYKKKRRNDKFPDMKEMIYICDLVRSLPKAYLIGVWEIIHEEPFREQQEFRYEEIDITTLKTRKIREVEFYAKLILTTMNKSKRNKRKKIQEMIESQHKKRQDLLFFYSHKPRALLSRMKNKKNKVVDAGEGECQKEGEMQVEEGGDEKDKEGESTVKMGFGFEIIDPDNPNPIEWTQSEVAGMDIVQSKLRILEDQLENDSSDSSAISDDGDEFD